MKNTRETIRIARHVRIRRKIAGVIEHPRLVAHRSLKNMHVQLIDDSAGNTLLSLSTTAKEFRANMPYCGNVKAASLLGELFAKKALEKGFKDVVFDRGGHPYQGRIKALAEGLRKGGLVF